MINHVCLPAVLFRGGEVFGESVVLAVVHDEVVRAVHSGGHAHERRQQPRRHRVQQVAWWGMGGSSAMRVKLNKMTQRVGSRCRLKQ